MNNHFITAAWEDYELLDAGHGKKLERFGNVMLIRPDIRADFAPAWREKKWLSYADVVFQETSATKGYWHVLKKPLPVADWVIRYQQLCFRLKETPFKHVGIFPEQSLNWDFMLSQSLVGKKALNLFAYTGAMSLACCFAGAETAYLDASKSTAQWAKENAVLSGVSTIRFFVDDALTFLKREERRGGMYDFISMDPPAYGIGAKGERWQLDKLLPELLHRASLLLSADGALILNVYSPKIDRQILERHIKQFCPGRPFDVNELCLQSTTGKKIVTGLLVNVRQINGV
jgi:23S rRNA (cytosine1962-C5)-methyltransferase